MEEDAKTLGAVVTTATDRYVSEFNKSLEKGLGQHGVTLSQGLAVRA